MASSERKKAFERAVLGRPKKNTKDELGTVQIRISLMRDSAFATGNITQTLSVAGARVSDVARVVETALFGSNKVA